ncbi:MAG: hypothetical protein EA379_11160 [Phycisphaerales bacterium]|nr:MAG: hypothetical protein EA379_11160 [Phycisphaerales bacterium]
MRALFVSIAPILHLTRVTTAFAAVANIWFVILWTRASGEFEGGDIVTDTTPTSALLAAGAVTAVGLFAFAAALNDMLDVRRDRVLHPLRPLPSGSLNMDAAVGLVIVSLMVAILGAAALGTPAVFMCVLTAGAALFYHGAAKFVPSVGLVALSLIYGAHMMIPNVELTFVWPVWLVMTHALLVGAVTHRLGQRRPALSPQAIVAATLGWAFWSCVLLYVGWARAGTLWPEFVRPTAAIGPALLAVGFVALAWRKSRRSGSGARAAEKITRYGALWLSLYGTAWLLGQGYTRQAIVLGGLTALGFAGMTVLRELYALIEQPLTYRR